MGAINVRSRPVVLIKMNKLKINILILSVVVLLLGCNGEKTSDKKCECVKDGVQVSMPPEMSKDKIQSLCSKFGGQLQNCP